MDLNRDLILEEAKNYSRNSPTKSEEDRKLRSLPKKFRHRSYTTKDLEWIVKWKSPRSITHFKDNKTEYIRHIIDIVIDDIPLKWNIKHLKTLNGVGVPMASSFLLFIDPNKYTIIDKYAWNTLHKTGFLPEKPTEFNPENYKQYLDGCRELSDKFNVSLRILDRALFQIDKNTK